MATVNDGRTAHPSQMDGAWGDGNWRQRSDGTYSAHIRGNVVSTTFEDGSDRAAVEPGGQETANQHLALATRVLTGNEIEFPYGGRLAQVAARSVPRGIPLLIIAATCRPLESLACSRQIPVRQQRSAAVVQREPRALRARSAPSLRRRSLPPGASRKTTTCSVQVLALALCRKSHLVCPAVVSSSYLAF